MAMLERNAACRGDVPFLAGSVCLSPFDAAVHDAVGRALGRSAFRLYETGMEDDEAAGVEQLGMIRRMLLAEPVAPSGHLTRDATEDYCFVCGSPQSTYLMNADTLSKARACDHCSPAFKAELAERDRVDAVVAETVDAQRAFALRWLAIGRLYMEWLNDLADYADDAGIEGPTEEDLEQERQLQRQRDARYERY
jgi:hypothetical protein